MGFDLVILAGPTWSYNPSGAILYFLDHFAKRVLAGKMVLPVISCRGYWRLHWFGLKRFISRLGGTPLRPWVFEHKVAEPWRTIGVFLTIAGKRPMRNRLLRRHYSRYGHSRAQTEAVEAMAERLGDTLRHGDLDPWRD